MYNVIFSLYNQYLKLLKIVTNIESKRKLEVNCNKMLNLFKKKRIVQRFTHGTDKKRKAKNI